MSRTVIVTGASSGIGAEVAITLARAGDNVVAVGRDAARLTGTIERAEARSGSCIGITTDLTTAGAAQRVVDEAIERLGRIDAVVHSAGLLESSESDEALEVFDRQWLLNVRVPYELTLRALPQLRANCGSVVFVSSIAARHGFPDYAGYCATKGAVESLVRALAVDEAVRGVRVNAVALGEIRTRNYEEFLKNPDFHAAVVANVPLGRLGEAREVAPAIAFLLSDAAAYITGVSVAIDGGRTAG